MSGVSECKEDSNGSGGIVREFDGISGREWHEPLRAFSASAESDPSANIENIDAVLLPKAVTSIVLPWLACLTTRLMDPYSPLHCQAAKSLLLQLLDYDPSPQEFSSILLTPLMHTFHQHFQSVCIPLIKFNKVDINETSNSSIHNATKEGLSRYFLVKQLTRVRRYLKNFAIFKEFLSSAAVAKEVWWVVGVHAIGGLAKLMQYPQGDEQEYNLVYGICNLAMSLITISDNELQGCGISILQYKLLQIVLQQIALDIHNPVDSSNSQKWTQNRALFVDVLRKMI